MTDQHNKQDKNLYRDETAQVHAPADLILRTKQAVAEEEKRLQRENGQNSLPEVSEGNGADTAGTGQTGKRKEFRWKRYDKAVPGWLLPLTAAAVLAGISQQIFR